MKLGDNPFVKNIGKLTGATAIGQMLAVLALPILTRLYTAEEFSILAVYMAIIGIFTTAACLRFNLAISLPFSRKAGFNILALCVFFSGAVSFVLLLLIVFFKQQVLTVLQQPTFEPYLWMIPLGVFVASLYNALQFWAAREKRFGLVAKTKITRAVGGVGTQLMFGIQSTSAFGLLFGHMIFGGLGVVGLLRDIWRNDRNLINKISFRAMRRLFSRYRRFPIYSVPEALFNVGNTQIPILVIAAVAAGPEAGFLMLAMRVVGLPMGLIGTSVSQVYISEAPQRNRHHTLESFTKTTMWTLFKLGAPFLCGIGLASYFLFPYVFGAEWFRAGELVLWMTPLFVAQFVVSPVSTALHVMGYNAVAMVLQAGGLVFRVGAILLASQIALLEDNIPEVYAVSGFVFYISYVVVVLTCLRLAAKDS